MAVNFSLVLGGFIRTLRRPSVRNRLRQPNLPAAPVAVRDPSHHSTTASIGEDGDDADEFYPDSHDSDQLQSDAATESSDQNSSADASDLTKPPNSASLDVPDTIPEANLEHQQSLSAVVSEPDVSVRVSSIPSPNTAVLIAQHTVVSKVPSLLLEPETTELSLSTSTPSNTADPSAPPVHTAEETGTPFNSVNEALVAPRPVPDPSVKTISLSENEYVAKHRTVSVGTSSASNRRSIEARNAQSPSPAFNDGDFAAELTADSSACEISPAVLEALKEQEQMSYDFEADHVAIVHDEDALPDNRYRSADEHDYLSVPATAALTSGHASTYIASPQMSAFHSHVSDSGQSLAVCDSLRDMTDASLARDHTISSEQSEQPHGNIHSTEPMGLSTHHSSDGSNFRSDSEYTENESRDRISELKQRNDSISAKKLEQIQQLEKERSAAESSKTQSHSISKQASISAAAAGGRAPSLNRSSSAGSAPKLPSDKPLYRMPSHSIDVEWVLSDRVTFVWDLYDRIRQLGVPGAFGSAHLAREKATGAYRVVKVISKRNRSPAELIGFHKEIEAMKALDHPNVVKFHAAYETRDELHIVMEYCSGGDLFDEIERMLEERGHAKYCERDASRLLKHVLLGLEHMHSKKIAHCDLKPDNFVYENKEAGSPVKIIDFGMARFWNARQRQYFTTHCGTLYYTAPEVIERKYNLACDMWSMGVITYLLLVGYPPFYANPEDYKRMYPDAKEARTALQHDVHAQVLKGFQPVVKRGVGPWFPAERPISPSAMNLISRLLDKNVATRLTVLEALEHPWIGGTEAPDTPLSTMVVRSLKTFDAKRLLQQAAIGIMSDLMSDDDLRIVMRTFKSMDVNGDGLVSISDFRIAMSMQKNRMDPNMVEKIFKHTDLDEDGFLCYREILYACIAARLIAKEERLRAAFSKLDVNGDGKISPEEIRTLLEVDKNDATTIIQEVDRDNDGQVDYEEFLAMWRENSLRTPSGF